jgi:hypothetical protein
MGRHIHALIVHGDRKLVRCAVTKSRQNIEDKIAANSQPPPAGHQQRSNTLNAVGGAPRPDAATER